MSDGLRAWVGVGGAPQLPPAIDALLDRADDARGAFLAGPILTIGASEPARAYVADLPDGPTFRRTLRQALPDPAVLRLLDAVPEARVVLDASAARRAVFLDDLHTAPAVPPALRPPHGLDPLAAAVALPGGEATTLSRHGAPPRHLLPPVWQRQVDDLLHAGFVGLWAVRWRAAEVVGVVWINDTRWRGDVDATIAAADRLAAAHGATAWSTAAARAAAVGGVAYPDAIEVRGDGALELTVGLLPVDRPDVDEVDAARAVDDPGPRPPGPQG